MNSQDPKHELALIQEEIEALNARKEPLVRIWERETGGKSLFGVLVTAALSPTLREIRTINQELSFWHAHREAIRREHPSMFLASGEPKDTPKRFSSTEHQTTQAAKTAADRHQRKKKIHFRFKDWCGAQRPQIKASLEHWENAAIRARFQADLAAGKLPPKETDSEAPASGAAKPVHTRGLMPPDFGQFLKDMGHRLAGWSHSKHEELWQSDHEQRELYALWLEERAQTQTPT